MNANNPKKVRAVECGNLANRIQLHRTFSSFFFYTGEELHGRIA